MRFELRTNMNAKIKSRPLSQAELDELKVKVKVIYLEEGQTEKEAIEEESKDIAKDEEIYLVVMEQGEKLPEDKDEKLKGYSVNNPYHAEKDETVTKQEDENKNTTAAVNNIIARNDVEPVKEVTGTDSTAVLDIKNPVVTSVWKGLNMYTGFKEQKINHKTFMTVDGDDMGYQTYVVPQLGSVQNNYSFMVRRLGDMPGGSRLDMILDTVDSSLRRAQQEKVLYTAPEKSEYQLRYSLQPTMLAQTGVIEELKSIQSELLESNKYVQGQSPEVRRQRAHGIDELIETLARKKEKSEQPLGYEDDIIYYSFHVPVDPKVLNLKRQIEEIDKECMVPEDYYNKLYESLQTTDKQIERPSIDYIRKRHEYYDVAREVRRPDLVTQFLQHRANVEFSREITVPQVLAAAYEGVVLPLSNVGDTAGDFATSLHMSATTVSSDGKLANLASASTAAKFLHDYMGAMLHEDIWLKYPLISTQRMYTTFDLAIMMDALFYPLMLNFAVISFDDVRALRNYVYYFICRPVFDLVDILGDGDSGRDMLSDFLVQGHVPNDRSRRELYGAMRRYFGTADYADLGARNRAGSFVGVPADYTSNLSSTRGAYKEEAVTGVLEDYIFREKRTLLYSTQRHGMPGGIMLNGSPPTVSEKPRVGIWEHASEFANKFHTAMSDPNMRRVIAAIDGNTIISMAKIFKKVLETRAVGFQHRLNEMNYFTFYMSKFGFVFPKSILHSLNYEWDRAPVFKEIQPGSIFSSVALTTVSDLRQVVLPDPKTFIDGLDLYNNIETWLVMKSIIKNTYSPEALQDFIGYERPIKRADNTDKALLMKTFDLYGSGSPVINTLKLAIEKVTLDYIDSWYFPDDEIARDVVPEHTLTRKFELYLEYYMDEQVRKEHGVLDHFYLAKLDTDEQIDEESNGGITNKTQYRALRRVDVLNDPRPTEIYDEETFFKKYVQGEDFDALFKHIRSIRRGETRVKIDIPVKWSISEMDPNAPDDVSSKALFPISWDRANASSVKAKDVKVEYWPSYTVTGEREFDEKYMFMNPKYTRTDYNPIMVTGDRFTTMEDLLKHDGLLTKLSHIPEKTLTLRPDRNYFNPVKYADIGNL